MTLLQHGSRRDGIQPRDYALASLIVAGATAFCFALQGWVPVASLSLVFVCGVLAVALRSGRTVAAFSALLSALAYNYFFTEPRFTLRIHDASTVVAVAAFVLAALMVGHMASRQRGQLLDLQRANARIGALQRLGLRLAAAVDEEAVLRAGAGVLDETLDATSLVLAFPRGEAEPARFAAGPLPALASGTLAVARAVAASGRAAGRFEGSTGEREWWFLPLGVEGDRIGAVGLRFAATVVELPADQRLLAEAIVAQTAQAAGRARLAQSLEASRVEAETERLRTALLSSVSHDLRSPLAAVIGAASSLAAYGDAMPDADRSELVDSIRSESERLDRYIQNLLDMTRLGSGPLRLERDWVGLDEIVAAAAARLRRLAPGVNLAIGIEAGLPALYVHPALIEQALFNVLENAANYSPAGEPIRLAARRAGDRLVLELTDRGPGISAEERERIFDLFYSGSRPDGTVLSAGAARGSGLGLTIVRGMIRAHGGSVEALPGDGGVGTTIRIALPIIEPPRPPEEEEER